ncbi:MAG: hypothetical protein JNM56_05380 [Planctomycetia bacterium]|nr:hypothetical protein [Planctomycetia bacterium]
MIHSPSATRRTFRPNVERLEDRTVPAGTLNLTLVNGTLTITAVSSANPALNNQSIVIQGDGTPGTFTIQGADGESINGPAGAGSLTGVTNIKLNLGAGHDTVTIDGAQLAGTLTVNGGSGNTSVILENADSTFGSVRITNGMGNDLFQADAKLNVTGNLTVNNGHGDTKFLLNADTDIGGNLSITNTGGIDIFTSKALLDVAGNLTMNNGAGTVRLLFDGTTEIGGNFSVINGYGGDTTDFNGSLKVAGNLSLNYGTSDGWGNALIGGKVETVQLTGSSTKFNAPAEIGGNLTIRGQGGIDRVVLDGVTVNGTTLFDLGAQDDVVILTDSTFVGRTTINTGAGNDRLTIGAPDAIVTFQTAPVRFDGGAGIDTLERLTVANVFPPLNPIQLNWEIVS